MLLAILTLFSLALAEYAAGRRPVAAFFLLPTRGWELALGSLIAFSLEGKERGHFPPALSQILSLVGLGMIAVGVLAFSEGTPFPGLYALVPTVGAGLIIGFALPQTLVGRLLASRVLVGVGLISYSAYLWHQPLLSFARHRSLTEPNEIVIAGIIVLTFAVAYLSWRYVEMPFRHKDIITKDVLWRWSLASTAIIASFALCLQLTTSESTRQPDKEIGQLWRTGTCFFGKDQTYETLLLNQCHLAQGSVVQVSSKQSRPSRRYVLYGDSVAAHLYPGLLGLAGENAIMQLTGGSCKAVRTGNDQRCNDFYDWFVNEYVPNNRVDAIIVSSDWSNEYNKVGEKKFRVELNDLFRKLKGHRVVVYSQAASLSVDIRRYVHKLENLSRDVPEALEVGADNLTAVNAALREVTSKFGFDFIDVSQLFNSGEKCVVAKGGVFYFWDKIHLTLPGSVLVADRTFGLLMGTAAEPPPVVQDKSKEDGILSSNALMVRNLDGTIRYWSEGAKKLYGWEPQDALGRTSHHLLRTVFPIPLEVIDEVVRQKGRWEGSLSHQRRDGSKVTVSSRWDIQQDPHSHELSATVIEINGPLLDSRSGPS